MKTFGLIGYPLGHSWSAAYFAEKFRHLGLDDHTYQLFPLKSIQEFTELWEINPQLIGVNVTIPYKQSVIPFLDLLEGAASAIGAVNCILKSPEGKFKGFNTDAFGFEQALRLINGHQRKSALILGTGGASNAVVYVLRKLGISYQLVSRNPTDNILSYNNLDANTFKCFDLIINTTPLGMYPNVESCPDLPWDGAGSYQLFFDLVYNPEQTAFLQKAAARGAQTENGLKMLELQADASWEIWNKSQL